MVPVKVAGHAASTSINRAACTSHAAKAELGASRRPMPPACRHSNTPKNSVVVAVDVAVNVAVVVVVGVEVGVVVVVGVLVGVELTVVEVGVVDGVVVVVGVLVTVVEVVGLVVCDVVGVVTSQFWKLPRMNASVISFSVSTIASQVSTVAVMPAPAHVTVAASPAGPRNSVTAPARASAVALQVSAFCSSSSKLTSTLSTANAVEQLMCPVYSLGQTLSTCISTPA